MRRYWYLLLLWGSLQAQRDIPKKLSLAQAFDLANAYNLQLKIADNNMRTAYQKKWETIASGLPQISGKADYNYNIKQNVSLLPSEVIGGTPGTFTPVTFGTKQNFRGDLNLNQKIFDGAYLVGLRSIKVFLDISKLQKELTQQKVQEAVLMAYTNLLVSKEVIKVWRDNLKTVAKEYEQVQEIYKNGLNEQEAVEQIAIAKNTVEQQLNYALRQHKSAQLSLNLVLGVAMNTIFKLSDDLEKLIALSQTLPQKTFDKKTNLSYRIANNETASKYLLFKQAKISVLPTVNAKLNYNIMANAQDFNFFNRDQQWFDATVFSLNIKVPIFTSFQGKAQIRQTKIAYENALLELDRTERDLDLKFEKANNEYLMRLDNFNTAKKNLRLARRIAQKVNTKFQEGISSSLDWQQAQEQLYKQQQSYLNAIATLIIKHNELKNLYE